MAGVIISTVSISAYWVLVLKDQQNQSESVKHDSFSYNQKCANLFDKAFDTWKKYVDENYGGPGQPTLEPPQVAGIVSGWEGAKEFRESDCRFTVNDWAYLVNHQEQVWGYIDWPELKPYS